MGIRDFIEYLQEHKQKVQRPGELSEAERAKILREAEEMVGMAEAAVRELGSVITNRRVNLPEEHAIRFAQDIFLFLIGEEERIKERLR
ncbi:MAG TPA: hypothetical protein VE225_06115 [Rubrobacteraceae bacterium]|nr:hypothetical protein [Rubrobacteraceae bacterium]